MRLYFETFLGKFLRFVLAIFSSSCPLIDLTICFDAPRRLDFDLRPRFGRKGGAGGHLLFFRLG